jgi:hypothetical protein
MYRNKALTLISFTLFALPAIGMECNSIDVTMRPYYKIEIGPVALTHPAGFTVDISRTEDLEGTVISHIHAKGTGTLTQDRFHIDLNPEEARGYIDGTRTEDGRWKAEIALNDKPPHELICQ